MERRLVRVMQRRRPHAFLRVILLEEEVLKLERNLLLDRRSPPWQRAMQASASRFVHANGAPLFSSG